MQNSKIKGTILLWVFIFMWQRKQLVGNHFILKLLQSINSTEFTGQSECSDINMRPHVVHSEEP